MRRLSIALPVLMFLAAIAQGEQSVGKVDRLIPAGYINRGAATNEAKKADPVEWLDILRTNDAGRMRVAMDDGSMLSLGAHSELRVLKHDPKSSQTVIEMLYGKARANVVPIKKQGGGFEVRTPTAVIGVLGTTVDIETAQVVGSVSQKDIENIPTSRRNIADLINIVPGALPDKSNPDRPTIADYLIDGTLVKARDHSVAVRSIDPEIVEGVVLLPGQWTWVKRGMPPTPPRFGEPQADECSQTGACECPNNSCSDFYSNPQPQTDQARAKRPELNQSGARFPAICSFETLTLGLDNAMAASGTGHTGNARVFLDNAIDYEIVGRGTSTGQVFDVHVKNLTDCPLNIQIPAGTVLEPKGYVGRVLKGILLGSGMPPLKDFQVMMAEGGFGEIPAQSGGDDYIPGAMYFVPPNAQDTVFTLRGYCLELHKLAPHAKTNYKFADAGDQRKLAAPNLKVMEAANKLAAMRQLGSQMHTLDSIVQWSLWASREKMDAKKFREEFFSLVEKNYEGQKKKFDKDAKANTDKMVNDLWPLVEKVLSASR